MITIVDYGVGNLGSVLNMFKYIGVPANVSSSLSVINKASKLLLPGVGELIGGEGPENLDVEHKIVAAGVVQAACDECEISIQPAHRPKAYEGRGRD